MKMVVRRINAPSGFAICRRFANSLDCRVARESGCPPEPQALLAQLAMAPHLSRIPGGKC
jgi:hypothetical protein